jgi:hypothetical protein
MSITLSLREKKKKKPVKRLQGRKQEVGNVALAE